MGRKSEGGWEVGGGGGGGGRMVCRMTRSVGRQFGEGETTPSTYRIQQKSLLDGQESVFMLKTPNWAKFNILFSAYV